MHCPACGGIDNNAQRYCKACGTNLEIVRQALIADEKALSDEESVDKLKVLRRASTLRIIRFSLSTICILVPLMVLGGMAASGIALSQMGVNLIIWVSILAFGLGVAFDWEIGRYVTGEGEVINKDQRTIRYSVKELGAKAEKEFLAATPPPPSVIENTTKILETRPLGNSNDVK